MTEIAIAIPDDLREFMDQSVQSGQFSGPNEFVTSALYAFRDQAELEAIKLARLRRDIAAGLEQADRGEFVEFDAAAVIAECQRERAAGTTA
jgi:antitoxin ParD1/3/4